MPTLSEFNAQLERCAQSPSEVRDFVEAFSKVRLRYIARSLASPSLDAPEAATAATSTVTSPDWADIEKLSASGLTLGQVAEFSTPEIHWLHVDIAADPAGRSAVTALLSQTCLSDKQRKALFPALFGAQFKTAEAVDRRRAEVPLLNEWLVWSRAEGISPPVFGDYQKHLRIHGASQNAGGDVGAVGGAIAIHDALLEVAPDAIREVLGSLPKVGERDPVSVDKFLRRHGISAESKERPLKAILLSNHRAIIFASDPDVAIIQSLGEPFGSAQEAWDVYSRVRSDSAKRAQRIVEFAVGEVKAATDASNLHERMALSTRENRSERQSDRFLIMAILTKDLLTGGSGTSGRRNTRAPMQSREMGRISDVFNLHHAWGWDGGRQRHPEHWDWMKHRLKEWCGL
jgi:hypothetical protein